MHVNESAGNALEPRDISALREFPILSRLNSHRTAKQMWLLKAGVDDISQERLAKHCRNYSLQTGQKLWLLSLYQAAVKWPSHRTVLPPAHPVSLTL